MGAQPDTPRLHVQRGRSTRRSSSMGTRKSAGRPRWILVASGTHLVARASGLTCHAVLSLKVSRAAVSAAPAYGCRASVSARCYVCDVPPKNDPAPRAVFEHMQGHKLVRRRRFFVDPRCGVPIRSLSRSTAEKTQFMELHTFYTLTHVHRSLRLFMTAQPMMRQGAKCVRHLRAGVCRQVRRMIV